MTQCVHFILYLFSIHACLAAPHSNSIRKNIVLQDRYHYIIVGSDHVAQSIGLYLAGSYKFKTILVLQSNHCEQINESSYAPNELGSRISNTVAECALRMGYQFTDPLRHGQRVGICHKNRTRGFDISGEHTLWAIDPNLQLLSGAAIARLLYNHASSSVLGVELEMNGSKQCIFADEELLIAGRCLNDYKHLSRGSIAPEVPLEICLRELSLDISFGSPIMAPIFHTKVNATLNQSPILLGAELHLKTPECEEVDGAKPNAKLRLVMGNANLDHHVWVGFVPSLIWDDPNYHPGHEETVKMFAYVLKIASAITESDAFKHLNLTALDHRIPECMKYVDSGQYWTCFLDVKLKRFHLMKTTERHKQSLFDGEFRLKGVKSLRVLPFGLTAPFLDRQWRIIFPMTKEKTVESRFTTDHPLAVHSFSREVSALKKYIDLMNGLVKSV